MVKTDFNECTFEEIRSERIKHHPIISYIGYSFFIGALVGGINLATFSSGDGEIGLFFTAIMGSKLVGQTGKTLLSEYKETLKAWKLYKNYLLTDRHNI